MSLPHVALVARLKALATAAGANVYPLIAPQGTSYPCIVYQVIGNDNEVVSHGAIPDFQMRLRVSCLAPTSSGEQGYTNAWTLAAAVMGNATGVTPTGLVGWIDSSSREWKLDSCTDEIGEIMAGRDQFEAFVVSMVYSVFYQV